MSAHEERVADGADPSQIESRRRERGLRGCPIGRPPAVIGQAPWNDRSLHGEAFAREPPASAVGNIPTRPRGPCPTSQLSSWRPPSLGSATPRRRGEGSAT